MNYSLIELRNRVDQLISNYGEDAACAAWIYTNDDCSIPDESGEPQYVAADKPELAQRIFHEIGNIDHIYTVIQECVDEVTEEQWMLYQQELVSDLEATASDYGVGK